MQEDKRILLAVVLSIVVIIGSFVIQGIFMPPPVTQSSTTSTEEQIVLDTETTKSKNAESESPLTAIELKNGQIIPDEEETVQEEKIIVETNLIRVALTNRGGDVISYKLKEHKDHDDYVEMVLPGISESHAFTIAFGDLTAAPRKELFHITRISDKVIEFYRDYAIPSSSSSEPVTFRLTKRYEFKDNEYLFELSVTLDSNYKTPPLDMNDVAYTLEFGPQIGPQFEKLSEQYDYRKCYTYINGKLKQEKVNAKEPTIINSRISWAAIAGKYFTFISIPDATSYTYAFSSIPVPGIAETSRFYIMRPKLNASKVTDVYRFYLGPKTQNELSLYNESDKNAFKLRDLNLNTIASTGGILAPLEAVLKWLLMLFYKIIPNYGISIIFLTILVKALLFPLTKKGSESTLRMQELSPKIKEIQDKYKDNPSKMNMEMAALYKKEGYNPLSGCLPLLLQIPIFFAMYNLFNNHFDLRGALFIPGWIPDLSKPESVFSFAPARIPILNWSDIRLLPFIYLASQLLYGKITQTPDQKSNSSMKFMMYGMPIMFFFVLYNVPSGLLLYWIMSNILSLVQQLVINQYITKRKAENTIVMSKQVSNSVQKKKRR
jgi:YidC/Oxa1 family membrane protein insertase